MKSQIFFNRFSVFFIAFLIPCFSKVQADSTLTRWPDPVVVEGSSLTAFLGTPVNKIVGFRFNSGWHQIPIQIDEREYVDYGIVYNTNPVGVGTVSYVDPYTYTGGDSDPSFDSNDEPVFMANEDRGVNVRQE